jgi:3-deoxy-D-manno-octulosonic-acid transferase
MAFNFLLLFFLIAITPKLLIDRLKGKKHPALRQRLGASIPDPQRKSVIWIHAVSVGEAKAAQGLFRSLKAEYPNAFFLITTTTATGQEEAYRSLPGADAYRYLPLDFTWEVNKWAAALRPKLLILVESDFWPNLLAAVQKAGGKTALVSGKVSDRSARRFQRFSPLSKALFSRLDLLCVQNEDYAARFTPLVSDPSRIAVAGNLKLDALPQEVDFPYWSEQFFYHRPFVAIASTHAPEEELLLEELADGPWILFLAPRHPERFEEVAQILQKKKIPFIRWSQLEKKTGKEKAILVDAMGQLPICYTLSRAAIVAGSFTPKVGGHNVFEPCLYGCPSFFGPYTHAQVEFAQRVLDAGAGLRVEIDEVRSALAQFLENSQREEAMRAAASTLADSGRGALERTMDHLRALLPLGKTFSHRAKENSSS